MKKLADQKKTEEQLIYYFRKLPVPKKREALDFIEYLMTKSEWDATAEILEDKEMVKGIREGISQVKRGEVFRVEL